MTQDNKIKWNLQQIARVATDKDYFREWGAEAIVHYIRSVLDHLEELLQEPGPETLVETVRRLAEENRKLKQDLVTTERRVKSLRATCSKVMADAGVIELRASNVRLLRRNKRLEEDLKSSDAHIVGLQGDLARKNQQLQQFRAGWCPLSCAPNDQLKLLKEGNDQLEQNLNTVERFAENLGKENRKLKKDLREAKELITGLNKDLLQWGNENRKLKQRLNEGKTYRANLRKSVARRDQQLAQVHNELKEALHFLEVNPL